MLTPEDIYELLARKEPKRKVITRWFVKWVILFIAWSVFLFIVSLLAVLKSTESFVELYSGGMGLLILIGSLICSLSTLAGMMITSFYAAEKE
ncbi:MAG: hypothetical protein ACFFD4_24435 [Candidatus Odinarchaeota archaeon]